jgi:hypothetical protein
MLLFKVKYAPDVLTRIRFSDARPWRLKTADFNYSSPKNSVAEINLSNRCANINMIGFDGWRAAAFHVVAMRSTSAGSV